jgi:hypothetical protein
MPSGIYKHRKGYKCTHIVSEATKEKLRLSHLNYVMPETQKKNISLSHLGDKNSMNHPGVREKQKMNVPKGANHYKWNPNREEIKKRDDRLDYRYSDWRLEVYKRDNFTCKINNQDCEGRIEAHHILSYTKFPELRYDINNGITLCKYHHPRKRVEEIKMIPIFKELVLQH